MSHSQILVVRMHQSDILDVSILFIKMTNIIWACFKIHGAVLKFRNVTSIMYATGWGGECDRMVLAVNLGLSVYYKHH